MAYRYEITITNLVHIPVNLADRDAKIVWEKSDTGVNYKKTLSGSFTFYKALNETLFDEVMAMDFCANGLLMCSNGNNDLVAVSQFGKRDIDYNMDKCSVTIKPRWQDGNQSYIDSVIDEDFNILTWKLPPQIVTYTNVRTFEYKTCEKIGVDLSEQFDPNGSPPMFTGGKWYGLNQLGDEGMQKARVFCEPPAITPNNYFSDTGWSYCGGATKVLNADDLTFNITTEWFREVRYIQKLDNGEGVPPPSLDTETFEFKYVGTEVLNGITYNKYARPVQDRVYKQISNNDSGIVWGIASYYGQQGNGTLRINYRTRRLINILQHFASKLNCTLQSDFFTNPVNTISGANLKYLLIGQKSDAIFEGESQPSDPATQGVITMNTLMKQLYSMFQVKWLVDDGILYVEHVKFFKSNFQYVELPAVDLDLTITYPLALDGSYSYSYDKDLPIREKFSFQEAWNIDFIGTDIEYTNCLTEGSTITNAADVMTTDIDPIYLDTEASKDGFIMFHCDKMFEGAVEHRVVVEVGALSGLEFPNAHLSWANLHNNYWKHNRPLRTGIMNGNLTTFVQPFVRHKKQVPIEFPFCVENFARKESPIGERMSNSLVRTTMGDGEIAKAEYNMKSGNMKIELLYDDQ